MRNLFTSENPVEVLGKEDPLFIYVPGIPIKSIGTGRTEIDL